MAQIGEFLRQLLLPVGLAHKTADPHLNGILCEVPFRKGSNKDNVDLGIVFLHPPGEIQSLSFRAAQVDLCHQHVAALLFRMQESFFRIPIPVNRGIRPYGLYSVLQIPQADRASVCTRNNHWLPPYRVYCRKQHKYT